jgi:DNA uptake protein ComE-like DNA-binding protein
MMRSFFLSVFLLLVCSVAQTQSGEARVRINVNTATEEELLAIPGVGEKIAHELQEYRPFVSKEHFDRELGKYVDAEALAALSQHITIGLVNINTATEEELRTVPGVGEKIAHEITEYRPYTTWEQFEKELGKYIDEEAVLALEFFLMF